MKNIFLLPTNKKSRITKSIRGLSLQKIYYSRLGSKSFGLTNKHLYIISDEPVKIGDWGLSIDNGIFKPNVHKLTPNLITDVWGKIILTTDLDLIADGIQEIPESFVATYILLQNDYIGDKIDYVHINTDVLYDNGTDETFNVKIKIQHEIVLPNTDQNNIDYESLLNSYLLERSKYDGISNKEIKYLVEFINHIKK